MTSTIDFSALIFGKIKLWLQLLVSLLPNALLAIVVFALFIVAGRYLKKFSRQVIARFTNNVSLAGLGGSIIAAAVVIIGFFVALSILQLDKALTSLLAGAGIVGLALGFAFQDLTANFISGVFIAAQQPIRVDDVIETNGYFGKVMAVNLRSIIIDDFSGAEIEIPSKDVFQKPIKNFTKSGTRRMQIDCGIAYGSDLQNVQNVAVEAIRKLDFVVEDKPVDLHFKTFADSSINFMLWYWIDAAKAGPPLATSEAIKAIKKAFDENAITIPFPIRTLELSDKGSKLFTVTSDTALPASATQSQEDK